MARVTISQVRAANPQWFSSGNKRFFGDVEYKVLHGKKSKAPYLVRLTGAWTDMFGSAKRYHYRLNPIEAGLSIGPLLDNEFRDIEDVKDFLREV